MMPRWHDSRVGFNSSRSWDFSRPDNRLEQVRFIHRFALEKQNPDAAIIRLGIGDVTKPLVPAVLKAFHEGVDQMADAATFHGYGPEQGYPFLREAIAKHDYQDHGV